MSHYEHQALLELKKWQHQMMKKPTFIDQMSKRAQSKINSWIPEKIHKVLTTSIKQMVRTVLFGAELVTASSPKKTSLEMAEKNISKKIIFFKKAGAVEGGLTGAGGILLGLADFPLLLMLKMKLLFDIASIYGYDVRDYRERLYILYIFQLAFSSAEQRTNTYKKMLHWEKHLQDLPENIHEFDWKNFQQEYRDYIDLAKLGQLIPIIGAPIGALANYQLIKKLGITAMNAYRMRLLS